jgi:hypothetical protein
MVGKEYICSQALDIHTRIPGLKLVAWISAGKGKKRESAVVRPTKIAFERRDGKPPHWLHIQP